ncbi:MAG: hypothetical protein H6526_05235 [Actinobacteria bacterium]|nr:hypothetical protein [Actinomycetota bacterium]MCB9414669.1 hypothetical protein [Actinomycetota bacterium]
MRWVWSAVVVVAVSLAGMPVAQADRALPSSPVRPAAAGSLGSQRFEVSAGNAAVDIGAQHKAEFTSEVTLPRRAAGRRPLVVFLHGAHAACYRGRKEAGYDWPCPKRMRSLPSYQGYRYLADLLATQGFASLSVSGGSVGAVTWKCPASWGDWEFSKLPDPHEEGHLVDATVSQPSACFGVVR